MRIVKIIVRVIVITGVILVALSKTAAQTLQSFSGLSISNYK